jgi:hypothetical protein
MTVQLSPHFSLSEMTTTTGLPNQPASAEILNSLRALCLNVLEPIREHFGTAVVVHSG